MSFNFVDPYTGKDAETCSASVKAQNEMGAHDTGSSQTESEFNISKQLGEWGVIAAKLKKGDIPDGTKVLALEDTVSAARGYLYTKGKRLFRRYYRADGTQTTTATTPYDGEAYIRNPRWSVSIPRAAEPVASPTPSPAVTPGSDSAGSMSHEDVAALFVKVKDDLAKEQGLNIKGANPELDQLVYAKIGEATGYTPAEVKAKIDAYKAEGNKLSALKKKVLAGRYTVQTGKAVPAAQKAPASPLARPRVKAKVADPKPNGVPTVATPKLVAEVKAEVSKDVSARLYSDEDVAGAYVIAKDQVVAASNGKWTVFSRSEEMDALIAAAVKDKTGLALADQKAAIARYLAGGKKLSVLKKQLAKQGAFKPKANTEPEASNKYDGYSPGHWVVFADEEARIREMVEQVKKLNKALDDKQAFEFAKMLLEDTTSDNEVSFRNGPHEVTFRGDLSAAKQKEFLGYVDHMQSKYPSNRKMTIMVDPSDQFDWGTGGETTLSTGHMRINERVMLQELWPGMPVSKNVPSALYVLAHEWGHAFPEKGDARNTHVHKDAVKAGGMTRYGKEGGNGEEGHASEGYAEAFAEWSLTDGQTTNEAAQEYARRFHWRDRFGNNH